MKAVPMVLGLMLLLGAQTAPQAVNPHELKIIVSGLS